MKCSPIKFHEFMNQAIIDGEKIQTRRPIKPQPDGIRGNGDPYLKKKGSVVCKYGQEGDLLWVRNPGSKKDPGIWLMITDITNENLMEISIMDCIREGIEAQPEIGWKNYMKDAMPDLDLPEYLDDPVASFASLWERSYGLKSFMQDPRVWIISFTLVSTAGKPSESELEAFMLDGIVKH